jgi:hypothetical protein
MLTEQNSLLQLPYFTANYIISHLYYNTFGTEVNIFLNNFIANNNKKIAPPKPPTLPHRKKPHRKKYLPIIILAVYTC